MDRKRRRKESIWASHFRNAEKSLTGILYSLKALPNHKIKSSEKRKPIGIELYELDFETGATFSGTPLFFKPRVGGTCKITNTGQDYENDGKDGFTCHRRLREEGINTDGGLQVFLAYAFINYAFELARCYNFHRAWINTPWVSKIP